MNYWVPFTDPESTWQSTGWRDGWRPHDIPRHVETESRKTSNDSSHSLLVYLQYSLQRSPIILDELNPALSCFRLLIVQSSVFHLLSILERTGIFALPRSFWLLVWVHVRAPRNDEQRTNGKPRKYLLIGQQQTERAHMRKSTVSSPGFEFPRQKWAFLANNSK